MKKITSTIALLFLFTFSFSQTDSTNSLCNGRWQVCTSFNLLGSAPCRTAPTTFTFFPDGNYKEDREAVYGNKKLSFITGKWTLSGDVLNMDEDDGKKYKVEAKVSKIIWVGQKRFYTSGKPTDESPIVYTYFDKLPEKKTSK